MLKAYCLPDNYDKTVNIEYFRMNMNNYFLIKVLMLFSITQVQAQVVKATVVDNETNESIPYAIITMSDDKGVLADGDGYFEIELPSHIKSIDSLKIISIGYKDFKIALEDISNNTSDIKLEREVITMNEVIISNTSYSLEEIIEKVSENTLNNYELDFSKKKLFFRQHDSNKINKLNIEFKKSTIPEINQDFVNEELNQIPKTSAFYTEVFADWYQGAKNNKLDISKAVKFYDTYSNNYLDAFNTKLEEILNRNFKKDSYFKIKSGFFSIKTDGKEMFSKDGELLDMRNEVSKKEAVNENFFFTNTKKVINNVFSEIFYSDDSSLNFIKKRSRYDFELIDVIEYRDNLVYQINFFPNGSEDFKGSFYVNTTDFAILRIDYQNVARLRNIKLLGLSYQELGRKGTMIFEKGNSKKYQLKFIEQIQEDKYGIDRPLKIIEKNKNVRGRRKQNEISSEVDFISTVVRNFQVMIYDNQEILESQFYNQLENKKEQPKNWIKYYPGYWKGIPQGNNFSTDVIDIKAF